MNCSAYAFELNYFASDLLRGYRMEYQRIVSKTYPPIRRGSASAEVYSYSRLPFLFSQKFHLQYNKYKSNQQSIILYKFDVLIFIAWT